MSQQPPATAGTDAVAAATAVVDLGLSACEAYGRPDLAARLTIARRRLADPGIHIVVVGEFKQGKSSLVNALLGAPVCPVDDDVATAVPTYVRHGAEAGAHLILDEDPPRREPIPMEDVRRYAVEGGQGAAGEKTVAGVEVLLPRTMLAGGLVVVDTPGLGGLGSAHAAASLAAISMADAVLFVTDASQELTRSELDFLSRARDLCGTVACVVTKTDFYPGLADHPRSRRTAPPCPGRRAPDGGLVVPARTRGQDERRNHQCRVRLHGPGPICHGDGRRRRSLQDCDRRGRRGAGGVQTADGSVRGRAQRAGRSRPCPAGDRSSSRPRSSGPTRSRARPRGGTRPSTTASPTCPPTSTTTCGLGSGP